MKERIVKSRQTHIDRKTRFVVLPEGKAGWGAVIQTWRGAEGTDFHLRKCLKEELKLES